MAHDREIAGIRCTQILNGLSDYLAGEVAQDTRVSIEAHLSECSWCEHFGGEFSAVVQQLRVRLAEPSPVSAADADAVLDFLSW
jgi:predicted anti-sigma-YlaC factor YlaD